MLFHWEIDFFKRMIRKLNENAQSLKHLAGLITSHICPVHTHIYIYSPCDTGPYTRAIFFIETVQINSRKGERNLDTSPSMIAFICRFRLDYRDIWKNSVDILSLFFNLRPKPQSTHSILNAKQFFSFFEFSWFVFHFEDLNMIATKIHILIYI